MTMKTDELLQRLWKADPGGDRDVYIITWEAGEPWAERINDIYVDEDDDLLINCADRNPSGVSDGGWGVAIALVAVTLVVGCTIGWMLTGWVLAP